MSSATLTAEVLSPGEFDRISRFIYQQAGLDVIYIPGVAIGVQLLAADACAAVYLDFLKSLKSLKSLKGA